MDSLSWFTFSILATAIFGVMAAFYKVPAVKKLDSLSVTFWSVFVSTILSFLYFGSFLDLTSKYMLILASIWGVVFSLLRFSQIYALKDIETNTLFPVTSTASLLIAVMYGILFFNEWLSIWQTIGIVLIIISIYFFTHHKGKLHFTKKILLLAIFMVLLSATLKVIHKYAADYVDIHAFQIYQYSAAALFTFILMMIYRRNRDSFFNKNSMTTGALIGSMSFIGGYLLLIALTRGPFNLITSIHTLYVMVAAVMGYLMFKENLTKKKIFLICLAILAILLLRLG